MRNKLNEIRGVHYVLAHKRKYDLLNIRFCFNLLRYYMSHIAKDSKSNSSANKIIK